jgi:hypothetical protein
MKEAEDMFRPSVGPRAMYQIAKLFRADGANLLT